MRFRPSMIECERCHDPFKKEEMVMVRRNNVWWTVCLECGTVLLQEEQNERTREAGTIHDHG